jgi:hypothetical protein
LEPSLRSSDHFSAIFHSLRVSHRFRFTQEEETPPGHGYWRRWLPGILGAASHCHPILTVEIVLQNGARMGVAMTVAHWELGKGRPRVRKYLSL